MKATKANRKTVKLSPEDVYNLRYEKTGRKSTYLSEYVQNELNAFVPPVRAGKKRDEATGKDKPWIVAVLFNSLTNYPTSIVANWVGKSTQIIHSYKAQPDFKNVAVLHLHNLASKIVSEIEAERIEPEKLWDVVYYSNELLALIEWMLFEKTSNVLIKELNLDQKLALMKFVKLRNETWKVICELRSKGQGQGGWLSKADQTRWSKRYADIAEITKWTALQFETISIKIALSFLEEKRLSKQGKELIIDVLTRMKEKNNKAIQSHMKDLEAKMKQGKRQTADARRKKMG